MAVQFIRGIATMDLEAVLLEKSVEWLNQHDKNEVFYLVPNHMKFEQEVQALRRIKQIQGNESDAIAATRFQVFSFYRLAWYYLQNTQYYSSETLTDAGTFMIFRKLLVKNESNLHIFRGEINQPGFIQQLLDIYHELKEGNIAIDDLVKNLDGPDAKKNDLQAKVKDIQLLFNQYEEIIQQYGIQSEEIIDYLADYLSSLNLKHVLFVIHGYHYFSARELQLIRILMQQSGEVKISFITNNAYPQECPTMLDLFYTTGNTYHQLYQLAKTNHIPILLDYVEKNRYLLTNPTIRHLGDYWISIQNSSVSPVASIIIEDSLQVWAAESIKEEISHIAREIRRLICEEKYRYQDIQLLTREMSVYETFVVPIFALHDIPVYLDRDMAMEQHPLVEMIQSLFSIKKYNYRYQDILRFLRTELFFPIDSEVSLDTWQEQKLYWRNQIDITENIVLAYGFEGHFWQKNMDWKIIHYDFENREEEDNQLVETIANEVRRLIQQCLPPFFQQLEKAQTGQEAARYFYHFLVENGIENQLMMWRNQAIAVGDLAIAKNHEQTWQALMTLLDEYVTIYGEDPFDLVEFMTIFSSGLEGLRYSKVPTAIDQVQVRTLDLAYPGQAQVVFAIGMTDQIFPRKFDNQTLFSDEDRQLVNDSLEPDQFLLKNTQQNIAKEPFLAYILFSSAKERLYISYPKIKDGIKEIHPSAYVAMIQKDLQLTLQEKHELVITQEASMNLSYIGTYRTLMNELTLLKRQQQEQQIGISSFWLSMEKELMKQPLALQAQRIFSSLGHKNIPESLEKSVANQLYGKEIYTSVSRMESFYRCQYQYFSRFGLGLKERELFGLTSATTGDFFHEVLDIFFKRLIDKNYSLTHLTNDELSNLTDEVLLDVFKEDKFYILTSSNRMNYIRYQLSQTIKKVSWALKKQSHSSGLTPIQTEILFGQIATQKGIEGLNLPLVDDGYMHIRGKIDRLDQLMIEDNVYLGVIDYKSSHKKFNLTEAYHGLAMQMLTYLDVVLTNSVQLVGKKSQAIGSLYMHVHNPILPYEKEEQKEDQLLKQFKFDGLLVNDEKILEKLDTQLAPKKASLIYPIEESAKEVIKPGRRQEDKFVTQEELQELLNHNRQKFIEAGNQITQGSLQLNPAYQGKERVACRFCTFRSVCNFDVMLPENHYHRIEQQTKKEIMNRLTDSNKRGETDE